MRDAEEPPAIRSTDPRAVPAGAPATRWRVPPGVPAAKLAAALVIALLGVLFGTDPVGRLLGPAAAAVLAGWAARDLLAPVRLAADSGGVTVVAGLFAKRRLAWPQIDRIRVDARFRLGVRTQTLEVDAGDSIHLFGRYDLGADPRDVAEALDALRPR